MQRLRGLIAKPQGMILVTGPIGSGKTTTLYAALHEVNILTNNIVTIEDPIEYQLTGINQVEVDTRIGLEYRYYACPLIPSAGRCWYASFPSMFNRSPGRRKPMTTAATHHEQSTPAEATLFVAFALSEKTWKLGFTTGHGQKPRERSMPARDHARVLDEIAQAKLRLGLPATAPVVSCDEAGRAGFWLHRFLLAQGLTNHGVDASSLEVNRRRRRAKSDGLDVRKLLSMLMR
jgi:hypothetical protein